MANSACTGLLLSRQGESLMADLANQAQPAVSKLLQDSEDQLYTELGTRLTAIRLDPAVAGSFEPHIEFHVEAQGITFEDVRDLGRRFFKQLSPAAYQVICGSDAEDTKERQKLDDAFSIGIDAVASSIAAVLVASLGLAPAIAAVFAAIVVKICWRAGYEAMCELWKSKLAPSAS